MIANILTSLCVLGLVFMILQANTRADTARAELVALKAHYATMDCVQVKEYEAQ